MIQRTFHPIGQGAFYTETHEDFNVVYDCGNWKNSKLATIVVEQSFKTTDVIDILFISHFDADHVNKVVVLKNHCQAIRNVVLPLLHENEKLLLVNFFKALKMYDVANLVDNPSGFFGDDTTIIFVEPSDSPEGNQAGEINIEKLKGSSGTGTRIASNTQIYSRVSNWFYVPYNYNYALRNLQLHSLFTKHGLDIILFINDLNYAIVHKKKIRTIYNSLSGQINQNSMMVYSGPTGQFYKKIVSVHHTSYFYRHRSDRTACIYTGDGDLNIVDIRTVFRQYWDTVGTVQIPHHGDIKCFSPNFYDKRTYYCPISVGTKNTYGHPATAVIAGIIANHSYPIQVTEIFNSGFIQIISN